MSRSRGFTLIELLVVISIISLLASVVLAALNTARDKGRLGGARYFAAQVDHVLTDEAVVMWDMDDCSGTVAKDRSSNGNDGTLVNGAFFIADSQTGAGCSVSFDGTDDYVRSPASFLSQVTLGPTQSFSAFAWIKSTDTSGSNQKRIIGVHSGSNYIYLNYGAGFPWIESKDLANTSWGGASPVSVADGLWHHVGYVIDRTAGKSLLYVDGKLVDFKNVTSAGGFAVGYFCAGAQSSASSCGGILLYNGLMDNVRFFTKGLTAMDVGKLYASEAPLHAFAQR